MTIKSPGELFCYLCDAVTPAECVCDKYCSKCDKQFTSIEAYRSHDCLIKVKPDVVGNTGMFEKATTASIKRNEEEYRRIWNAAIECAYHIAIRASESPEGIKVAEEVRKLKK